MKGSVTNTQYEENTMHRVMITDHVCHVIVPFVLLHSIVVALVQSAHGLSRLLPHGVLVRTTALLDPPDAPSVNCLQVSYPVDS